MIRSLGAMVSQGGYVPKWPMGMGDTGSMIGEHAASVVADSYLKGLTDYDIDALYAALLQTASGPLPEGAYGERECIASYLALGYCPADETDGSVSITLEHAYEDFCLARLADAVGKPEDAVALDGRAGSYANVWDPGTGFFRGRNGDGSFVEPFDPELWASGSPYVEATAWQYLWFVPHDESGLRALFGSDEIFAERLSLFFDNAAAGFNFIVPTPFYYHGNEPDIHSAFLFNEAGRPDLTRQWSRWLLDNAYTAHWDGLIGNDDAGTLSSWYVFASIGLFPWPCLPGYKITAPLLNHATLHLPGGDVGITAPGASSSASTIKSAAWDGKPLDALWLPHAAIASGGALSIEMAESGR
jgi:predicted alpha-1,2-mannosidase